MIDTILSALYTADVIDKMGDNYNVVYSWSAFSLCLLFGVFSFVLLVIIIYSLVRWFR